MVEGFGEKLRRIRAVKGYSQEYVAESLNISIRSYQRYENEQTGVDLKMAMKIAKFYNITIDDLNAYGEPSPDDKKGQSARKSKVVVSVELDGREENLQYWIKKLTDINRVI